MYSKTSIFVLLNREQKARDQDRFGISIFPLVLRIARLSEVEQNRNSTLNCNIYVNIYVKICVWRTLCRLIFCVVLFDVGSFSAEACKFDAYGVRICPFHASSTDTLLILLASIFLIGCQIMITTYLCFITTLMNPANGTIGKRDFLE